MSRTAAMTNWLPSPACGGGASYRSEFDAILAPLPRMRGRGWGRGRNSAAVALPYEA